MNETIKTITGSVGHFGFWDYGIFIALLALSIGIGIYFGFISQQLNTTEEYLLGGRRLKPIPVGISLFASQITAMAIIAIPSDIYTFGTQYCMVSSAMLFPVLIINYIFIPIFYNNQISNCYEYLELRFDGSVKKFVTLLFLVQALLALPITMYIPSIALAQVTGINVFVINTTVTSVCIIYTMMGGIKAIIWTDVLQGIIMLGSSIVVMTLAIISVGGISEVWNIAESGNRLEFFNIKLDLTTRHTFWNTMLGYTTSWTTFVGLNQNCVQRIMSLSSIQHARSALWIFLLGFILIHTVNGLVGISMYARYAGCDLIQSGIVDKQDKMVPYFVQDIAGHLPAISGIFISSVLSASLSTMSASLNSIAGVIYYDYIAGFNLFNSTDKNVNRFLKFSVVIIGIYSMVAEVVVAKFQYLFQLSSITIGITQGAIFGIFMMGMFSSRCNKKGALAGGIISFIIMLWIVVGSQVITFRGEYGYKHLPTSIEGCDTIGVIVTNTSVLSTSPVSFDDSFSIYKIAFPWFPVVGGLITIVVGVLVSLCTGGEDRTDLHPRLFSSLIHWTLSDRIKKNEIEMNVFTNK